jgi:hypothetical protein
MPKYLSYADWVDTMDTVRILPVNDAWEYQQTIINERDVEISTLKSGLRTEIEWREWHVSEINRLRDTHTPTPTPTPRKMTLVELNELIDSACPWKKQ